MGSALLFGLATAVPLVAGAAIGMRWRLPRPVLGGLMAFGAGTMVAATNEALFGPAFDALGAWDAGSALIAGAASYVVLDRLLERRLPASAAGIGLMMGAALDGVPENAALGASLAAGSIVLAVAIIVGNVPEAIGSAAILRDDPEIGVIRGLALWLGIAAILVAVTVAAAAWTSPMSAAPIALIQAFAGGAVIAVLSDTLMPEAYRDGGWWVGLLTAIGFLVAYAIG